MLTQAPSREDGAAAAPEDGAGPSRGRQSTPRCTTTDGRLSASVVGAGVDEEEEWEEDEEEERGEVEGEKEVEASEQAVGDAAAARPSPAAGRPPGAGGGHQAQGDSPGGRRISGGGVPGDVADAAGADEDGAEASDGGNKNDDEHALPASAGVPAADLAADQDVESERDDVGGDVDKMEAILWGPTGTYVKSPRVVHVRDICVADVTTRNLAKDTVLHHYNAQQRSGYDWAFGSMVVCHDWMQTGSAVHDDLTCGNGAASASAARAAAGADGSAGAAEGGSDGNGALPRQGPSLSPFTLTDYQALDPVKKQLRMKGLAAAGGQGINHVDVNVHDPVVLIDGAHRFAAMKRLLDAKHDMAVEWILVAWGGRRDRKPMSHCDTLSLGAASNDLPAISIAMPQLDDVVWAVNWVVTYNRLKPADERLRYVPGKTRPEAGSFLFKRAYDAGLVPMKKEGQPLGDDSLARIIKIALLNAVSPLTVECMLNYLADSQDSERAGPRLSVETLASNVLLNVNVGTDEENGPLRNLMLQIAWKRTAGSSMERRHQNRGKKRKARRLTRGGDVTIFFLRLGFFDGRARRDQGGHSPHLLGQPRPCSTSAGGAARGRCPFRADAVACGRPARRRRACRRCRPCIWWRCFCRFSCCCPCCSWRRHSAACWRWWWHSRPRRRWRRRRRRRRRQCRRCWSQHTRGPFTSRHADPSRHPSRGA